MLLFHKNKSRTTPHKRAPIAPSHVSSALPSLYDLELIPTLGGTALISSFSFGTKVWTALAPCPSTACLCGSYLGTWPHPLVTHSRLGRCTCRSPWCCGSGRRRAGGSGSTHQCLERPVEVLGGWGRPAGPPLPFSGQPSLSLCFKAPGLGRPSLTLAGHHGTRFEAICTGTFEASYDIGAGTFPTGVPNGALICVCSGEVRGWSGPSGSPHP